MINEPALKRQRFKEEEPITQYDLLAESIKLKAKVKGRVLMVSKVSTITFANQTLARFAYVLGSGMSTIEISVIGAKAPQIADTVTPLLNHNVIVDRLNYDKQKHVLKHSANSMVTQIDEADDLDDTIDFTMIDFPAVLKLNAWTRISIKGIIHEMDDDVCASEHNPGKVYTDIHIRDENFQGLRVRLTAQQPHMPEIKENCEIIIRNAKVNPGAGCIHADLEDMCSVQLSKERSEGAGFRIKMLEWPR